MSTYKVLQDIEAEDTIVGPLTLRQLIYALLSAACLYICFTALVRGAAFLIVFFLPIAAISGFFAFPWKGEQPTEIWALARLRFMVKPRVRIWNQSGIKEVVTVTVPRTVPVQNRHRSLSQYEVQSRLKALADTIDTRGWATRNANYQYYANRAQPQSDRLVNATGLQPGSIPMDAFLPSNDMLDNQSPVAQNLDAMLAKSSVAQRQRVMQQMTQAQLPTALQPPPPQFQPTQMAQPAPVMQQQAYQSSPQLPTPVMPSSMPPPNDYWFANGPGFPGGPPQPTQNNFALPDNNYGPIQAAEPTLDEQALGQTMMQQRASTMQINYGHMRVLQPQADQFSDQFNGGMINYGNLPGTDKAAQDNYAAPAAEIVTTPPVTRQPDPAILDLANNDDLDVATLARQANREMSKSPDEVEIRLH